MLFAAVMIVALLLGCVACSKHPYDSLNDAEYFQALIKDQLSAATGKLAAGMTGGKAQMDLQLGQPCMDMIEKTLFGTTNSGVDLSFISQIGLDMEFASDKELTQLKTSLRISDTEILETKLIAGDSVCWFGVPQLNTAYLQFDLTTQANAAQLAWVQMLLQAAPDAQTAAKLLNRYLALAVEEIDQVSREKTKESTKLTAKVYDQDALDAAKAILTALKDDQDVKQIIADYQAARKEADPQRPTEDLYAKFVQAVDDAIAKLPATAENTTDYTSVILYVDGDHRLVDAIYIVRESADSVLGFENSTLEIALGVNDELGSAQWKLLTDGEIAISGSVTTESSIGQPVAQPPSTVDAADSVAVLAWLSNVDFTEVFNNLRQAGVPEMLLILLQNFIAVEAI